jgi:aminoglycoside 3-N-acetyltransferase
MRKPMREVTLPQAIDCLDRLGIQPGTGMLVHSAIQFLGRPVGGPGLYFKALQQTLDISRAERPAGKGTLAVPAFNFAFARGEPFEPKATPSSGMGALSEYVRQLPAALRTSHPMQSLAVIGLHAGDLAGRDTPSAFDPGSAFERLLELDFGLLLLGADIQAVSIVHYSEQRAGVPYRYWKSFQGQVLRPDGSWQSSTYNMFVRDLEIDPQLDLRPVQAALNAQGHWQTIPLNYGRISYCRLSDFVTAADHLLADDPWALVSNRHEAQERYRLKNGAF